ncbi:MAG: hypothetical protein WCV92_02955 [Candidatus Buchananbacteria bacterium]
MNKNFTKVEDENLDEETMQDDMAYLIAKKNHGRKNFFGKNKTKASIQRELVDVYTNGDGKIPDLTKFDRVQRPTWKTVLYSLIAILVFLLAIAFAGFWFFSNLTSNTNFTNKNVSLKIESPVDITSGIDEAYSIVISNKEKVDLYDVNISLTYPDGFVIGSSSPKSMGEKKNLWKISVLKSGEVQKIDFTGKLRSAINSTQTFKVDMDFKPANVNADYKQEAYLDALISSSDISVLIGGPDKILANQPVEYSIRISNKGNQDLSNVQIVASYPQGFSFASSDVAPDGGSNNVWTISKLLAVTSSTGPTAKSASSTEKVIKIKGSYSQVSDSGNQEFKVVASLSVNGDYMPQDEKTYMTSVVKDQLDLKIVVNGSAENQPINFNDSLAYTISLKNTGQEDIRDLTIKTNLDTQILDFGTLVDENGGARTGNTLNWGPKQISKLAKLSPGEDVSINFQIKVKDSSIITNNAVGKFSVESSAEVSGKKSTSTSAEFLAKTKVIVNSISSDININAQARYYSDDNTALGSGSVNPKVGETSSYNIVWSLSNNLHDISGIEVSAVLPKNVNWDNKQSHDTGDIIYNSKTRKITWTISSLPKSAKGAEADFNVSITPNDNDLGKVLILIPQVNLAAKDVTTGMDITKSVKAITTSLDDPIMGKVSGIVE